jgi:hypothetical protein
MGGSPSAAETGAILVSAALAFAPPLGTASAASKPILVSVVCDSSPPALALFDLVTERFLKVAKGRNPQLLPLGGSADDRPRCQASSSDGERRFLWVATGSRLVRIDASTWSVETSLPLPDGTHDSVVDLAAWHEKGGPRVALAVDPQDSKGAAEVVVVDGNDGQVVSRFSGEKGGMSAIYALRRDGDLFALYNQREAPGNYASITGLRWSPTGGFSETTTMHLPGPGKLRGLAAFAPIGPGRAAAISAAGHFALLIDLAGPGTAEPFPELEWGESIVAAGGDLETLPESSEAPVFLVDEASGAILHRSPGDPRGPLVRIDLRKAGAPPSAGSHLVVSSKGARGLLSSPTANRLLLFDTRTLEIRGVVKTPAARPTSLLLIQ